MFYASSLQVNEFICDVFGFKSLYGLCPETLDSLVLELLPPITHTYKKLERVSTSEDLEYKSNYADTDDALNVVVCLLQEILNALRSNAGFYIPKV